MTNPKIWNLIKLQITLFLLLYLIIFFFKLSLKLKLIYLTPTDIKYILAGLTILFWFFSNLQLFKILIKFFKNNARNENRLLLENLGAYFYLLFSWFILGADILLFR